MTTEEREHRRLVAQGTEPTRWHAANAYDLLVRAGVIPDDRALPATRPMTVRLLER